MGTGLGPINCPKPMKKYWMAVASREHVRAGVIGGFAQVCHGELGALKSMSEGDGLIYYSPTIHFGGKDICRRFTALGVIAEGAPYLYEISPDFIPWRRDVNFLKSIEASIVPLLEKLSFIKDKKKWGFPFRRGCFEITAHDFELIAKNMDAIK